MLIQFESTVSKGSRKAGKSAALPLSNVHRCCTAAAFLYSSFFSVCFLPAVITFLLLCPLVSPSHAEAQNRLFDGGTTYKVQCGPSVPTYFMLSAA